MTHWAQFDTISSPDRLPLPVVGQLDGFCDGKTELSFRYGGLQRSAKMTPLERAARALWELNGRPFKGQDIVVAMQTPEPEPDWERYIPHARAVLQAIREPSGKMVDVGNDGRPGAARGLTATRERWRAMIDAALDEG